MALRDDIDPDGLLEYSVVFTDRSLNHMSARFVSDAQQILAILRDTYRADAAAIVPGGGTAAMESVARHLGTGRRCLVLRNGLFSYRWSQILAMGDIAGSETVLAARPVNASPTAPFAPAPLAEVTAAIAETRPEVVFAPHVETASGILLPPDYLRDVAAATHAVGGLFVLDCIASGALWVDMAEVGVDVLISAPQKGWSGSPCAGYVMLSAAGREAVEAGTSSSFALDLKKWLSIADGYVAGQAGYHSTMPTDTLARNLTQMRASVDAGLESLRERQLELGSRTRAVLAERGFASVAAPGFEAPGVVVSYTDDPQIRSGAAFKPHGLQVAAGVALFCGEPEGFSTFRIGLFGLDKLGDVDGTVARLAAALDALG